MNSYFKVGWVVLGILSLSEIKSLYAHDEIRIGLASASKLKKEAVEAVFRSLYPHQSILITPHFVESGVAEQPVGLAYGKLGAKTRLENARLSASHEAAGSTEEKDYWISIENFIEETPESTLWKDQAVVIVQKKEENPIYEYSAEVSFDAHFAQEAKQRNPLDFTLSPTGFAFPVGKVIAEKLSETGQIIPHDDWHQHPSFGKTSRKTLIEEALLKALIKTEIDSVPLKGVDFKSLFPLLTQPEIFNAAIDLLAKKYANEKIDAIAGLDSRGYLLGAPLALKMNLPFIPVTKRGKSPRPSHVQSYSLEYGRDEIEISMSYLKDKTIHSVLIIDDLLATGGTLSAAEKLFQSAGVKKTFAACLIELLSLKGQSRLESPFYSILQYE